MTITQRIDNVTSVDGAYRSAICPAPKSIKIEITSHCNYRCDFCVRTMRRHADGTLSGQQHMNRALYSRIINEAAAAGIKEVGVFYIGESFACPWLPDAIREAKLRGIEYVFLTTNGSIATAPRVEACMRAGLDSLKFSLNFYEPAQLQRIAKVASNSFQRVIDNIIAARAVRDKGHYHCGIYASSIAFDGEQGEKMRSLVEQIKPYVDEHYWLPLYGMGGAADASGYSPHPGNPGRLACKRDPIPCWAVFTEAHITVDGKLSACCFGNDAANDLCMADLNECSLIEGWNSQRYQALRSAHLSGDVRGTACSSCVGA